MATYQIVPYLISLAVRSKPSETRRMDDLDGSGLDILDVAGGIFTTHRAPLRLRNPSNLTAPIHQITSVRRGDRAVFVVIAPGETGIASEVEHANGTHTVRSPKDTEWTDLRHVVYRSPGSHRALLLAERVGQRGAVSPIAGVLRDAWSASKGRDAILKVNAATSEEHMRQAIEDSPITGLRFTLPNPNDPNLAAMSVGGQRTNVELRLRPKRKRGQPSPWTIGRFRKGDEPLITTLLSEVTPILMRGADPEAAAIALLEQGWRTKVEVKLPGGTKRTIDVATDLSVTMSFPVVEGRDDLDDRPTDVEFADACNRVIETLYPGEAGGPDPCTWGSDECDTVKGWKVVWDEPVKPVAGSN
jgi:hypothetical protein